MSAAFEELDFSPTPIGEVSLRRRRDPATGTDVFEVKLGDEFLMSSMFTVAEIELARIGLARLDRAELDVVVGGLGLGYTARAALEDARVRELVVVEFLEPVIDWHRRGLVPVGPTLTSDARCRLVQGDFFALADGRGFRPRGARPHLRRRAPRHRPLASPPARRRERGFLRAGGDPPPRVAPDPGRRVRAVVERPSGPGVPRHPRGGVRRRRGRGGDVPEPSPGGESANTVYVGTRP